MIARSAAYIGFFGVTFSTLLFELLLTRLFSVVTLYHFAFMAISIAMFGATAGAILVFLVPKFFTPEKALSQMAVSSLLFGITSVLAMLVIIYVPFSQAAVSGIASSLALGDLLNMAFIYMAVSVPHFFSGICVTLALTRFPLQTSSLYATDLAGAACGCIAVIPLLQFTDGPTAVVVGGAAACIAGALIAFAQPSKRLRTGCIVVAVLMMGIAGYHVTMSRNWNPPIRVQYSKGEKEKPALYEKWNAYSRIRVEGDPSAKSVPAAWGMSQTYEGPEVQQLLIKIDGGAGTSIMKYDGPGSNLDYLKYDIVNLAQYLRADADVLAIGSGGGRDILSALAFNQKSVTGVEINNNIVKAITGQFREFSGNLTSIPNVEIVNDEARSFIASTDRRFDIIQISLIDTWAASSAGAYVLSENGLYTQEAWEVFLRKLKPGGILTVSRWYNRLGPTEVYRTVSLAAAALQRIGQKDTRPHILVARSSSGKDNEMGVDVGTILVSNEPFNKASIEKFQKAVEQLKFQVVLSPDTAANATFASLASGQTGSEINGLPLRIDAPSDNSPFFFNFVRLRDIFNSKTWQHEFFTFNLRAVSLLGGLLILVTVLALVCILLPLRIWSPAKVVVPPGLALYFGAIGMGFMLVEISLLQRLIVFLGYPIYGLAAVLFTLLLSAGAGSYCTRWIQSAEIRKLVPAAILMVVCGVGILIPNLLHRYDSSSVSIRIMLTIVTILPLGLMLGMAFPLGMELAQNQEPELPPWLFGINGATSVVASVLAMVLAVFASIPAAFWCGTACYAIAAMVFATQGPGKSLRKSIKLDR